MLIPLELLIHKYNLHIKGVIHAGIHGCDEAAVYAQHGIPFSCQVWIETELAKIAEARLKYPELIIIQGVLDRTTTLPSLYQLHQLDPTNYLP